MKYFHIGSLRRKPGKKSIVLSQNEHESSFSSYDEGKEHLINITYIEEKLEQVSRWEKKDARFNRSIFKVPKNLREVESEAYIPQLVSIGPYHRNKVLLKEMENQKWRLLQHFQLRTHKPVKLFCEEMQKLEQNMRRCYAQPFEKIKSPEFVEMMLLDACFVVELLNVSSKRYQECGYSKGDPIFSSGGVLQCLKRDMLMIENQIPLFVLNKIYESTCNPGENNSVTVSQLAIQFFDSVIPVRPNQHHKATNSEEPGLREESEKPGLHLLGVVHQCLYPSQATSADGNEQEIQCLKKIREIFQCLKTKIRAIFQCLLPSSKQLMWHSVMTLRSSGVSFQKKDSENFIVIEFKKGILYIPPLVIHDSTMSIFLNLMAFEQYYPDCSNHVTSYIRFMDGLINSPRDVEYLRNKGIINHKLGSEQEVADLVNKFCKEIVFDIDDKCYLYDLSVMVNRYVDQKWHVWRSILKHQYFTNPWTSLSILAASILLLLTLLQTIYTVMGYYKDNNNYN
ncbi:hypothetical protein HHK36_020196 [Tetracentron sinense]|uniref:Uncharacterized protein n=1 Tax=Tetracentron sinense TaxID=13715 RepID=A0A835DBE5_TETSI|nr:hypothetical protein HHK36_020196 [Tetracentron sinense]